MPRLASRAPGSASSARVRSRPAGIAGDPLGGQPQRERQPAAQPGDLVRALVGHRQPGHLLDQGGGRGRFQHVQRQRHRALPDHKTGEPVPACHDRPGGPGARQQWPDLLGVAGVVEHDQDRLAGRQGTEQGGALAGVEGDALGGHAKRPQEALQGDGRCQRRCLRVVALEVDVERARGERALRPVRPPHREGGLADAAHTAHRDHPRRSALRVPGREQGVERGESLVAAHEAGSDRGQLPGHRMGGRARGPWWPGAGQGFLQRRALGDGLAALPGERARGQAEEFLVVPEHVGRRDPAPRLVVRDRAVRVEVQGAGQGPLAESPGPAQAAQRQGELRACAAGRR